MTPHSSRSINLLCKLLNCISPSATKYLLHNELSSILYLSCQDFCCFFFFIPVSLSLKNSPVRPACCVFRRSAVGDREDVRIRSSGSAGPDEAAGQPGSSRQQQAEGGSGGRPDHSGGPSHSDYPAFDLTSLRSLYAFHSRSRSCARGVWSCSRGSWEIWWSRKWLPLRPPWSPQPPG